MTERWQEQVKPGAALHSLIREATAALIAMDSARLEELARCCADLNRELHLSTRPAAETTEWAAAAGELSLFGRILFETRANLVVLTRLHAMRLSGRQPASASSALRPSPGAFYGDN